MRLAYLLLLAGLLLGACGDRDVETAGGGGRSELAERPREGGSEHGTTAPAALLPPAGRGPGEPLSAGLPGFLVWESNRSGEWRLWVRDLEGSEASQLTPDEPGRRHCCAHVAPDGRWIAYLSLHDGKQVYSHGGAKGPLRLIRPDGSEEHQLAPAARTYFEHRAAVWRSPNELIYIDGSGRTVLKGIQSGETELLTVEELEEYGSLVDSSMRWATSGRASFSTYQADQRQVALRYQHQGCQPYFSHDGRWGFWTAGAGGPINRLELETGRVEPILHKNDSRMPAGLGYLYFPMLSRDGSMLAVAASRDEHDHFRGDYEIFVAEVDPESLELAGDPIRMTDDPATDRFPDVHVEPLELGRLSGEAPFETEWKAPAGGDWRWDFGDGEGARGTSATHRFVEPGRHEVTAVLDERRLRGRVTVRPTRAPRPLHAVSREGGRRVEVLFDEPVTAEDPELRFESGAAIAGWTSSPSGRAISIELRERLAGADTLHLSGFVDRAQAPNPMASASVDLEPSSWPSDRDGLAFVWMHGAAPNLVFDRELGAERACTVAPSGRAVLDHDFAMVLGRGAFRASEADMDAVLRATRGSNRMTLEAFVTPGESGSLIRAGGLHLNFALRAEAGRIHFSIRTGIRGPGAFQGAQVAAYEPGESLHLAITYAPGRMAAFVDGESAGEWPLSGDFFHWKRYPLVFGDGVVAAAGSTPRLEGVAIYSRILSPAEIRENYQRHRAARAARPTVPRAVVEARLVRRSRVPSLREISPYREALVIDEWEVIGVVAGEPGAGPIRIARWAILDGTSEPAPPVGETRRLTLEPFDRNPQLEGVFVSDDLGPGEGSVYYAVD